MKTIARGLGLNATSNGQLMKTDLLAGGLAVRGVAMDGLGLGPQRVPDGLGNRRPLARYRCDLDPAIGDRALGRRNRTVRSGRLFRAGCHAPNMVPGTTKDKAIPPADDLLSSIHATGKFARHLAARPVQLIPYASGGRWLNHIL